jgi:long-chain fatty acid transport protein
MTRTRLCALLAPLALCGLLQAQPMGGLAVHETGGPDMGSAYAGAGARASDASTVWLNPAGLTRLEGIQLVGGSGFTYANLELELDAPGTISVPPGNLAGGGHCGGFFPLAASYTSVQLGDRLAAGVALLSPYGGAVDYDLNFVGRSLVTEASFFTVVIQPTGAFQVTDWLSVGAGLDIVYGEVEEKLLIDVAENAPGVALLEISDAEDWGIGGNIGILLEPFEGTRVGVVYTTQVELDLEGKVANPSVLPANVALDFTLPHSLNVSLCQALTPEIDLLLDAGWSHWSEFGSMPITIGPLDTTMERDWDDTWRIGAGGQWQVNDSIRVRGGFAYDSAAVDDDLRLPDFPVGDAYRLAVGGEYRPNEHIELGASYTAVIMDLDVDSVALPPRGAIVLDGEYDPATVHVFGMSLNLRF